MNDKNISALISALVDHEDDPRRRQALLDRILADDGARKTWQNYHLIGGVLRGEVEHAGADLSERIRARLESEPTVLAPAGRRTFARRSTWKSIGALALAASVALVAVITLGPVGEEDDAGPIVAAEGRFAEEVSKMLSKHGEFTSSPGLNGLVGYAKLVSGEAIEK